jgi:hypothetical protein
VSAVCFDRQTLCEAWHTLNGKAAEMQKVSRRLQERARPKCLDAFIGGHFEAKILENARLYWCLSIFCPAKAQHVVNTRQSMPFISHLPKLQINC